MTEFFGLLKISSIATFELVFITMAGAVLQRLKLVNNDTIGALGKLQMNFLLPCLIFGSTVKGFSVSDFDIWIPALVICTVCLIFGLAAGYGVGVLGGEKKFFMAMMAFPHTTSL